MAKEAMIQNIYHHNQFGGEGNIYGTKIEHRGKGTISSFDNQTLSGINITRCGSCVVDEQHWNSMDPAETSWR
jgi:hypothetical protein